MPTEVELKLALPPGAVTRLRRHALLRGVKSDKRELLSIYFDTADHRLAQRGIALRLRRIGYHWIQTLKAEAETAGALSRRPEWEMQVTGNLPDLEVLPEEARCLLEGIAAADLRPCFSTEFTRVSWHLEREGAILELALDQGVVRAGELTEVLSEVEFELKAGDTGFLYETAASLLDTLPLALEPRSKAQRGYTLAGVVKAVPVRASKVRPRPADDARTAWRAIFDSALTQLLANVPGVLNDDDTEYLHQMRIAVRRLRATLSLGRDLGLESPAWRTDLRWLMDELSPARDWDVFATETLPRVLAKCCRNPELDVLAEAVAMRRTQARARARETISSRRFIALVLAAEQPVTWPETGRQPDVSEWARRVLARRLKKLRRLGKEFAHLDSSGRHVLRIAAKRLRYSAEAFSALYGKAAEAYLVRLGRLQDGLGVANDLTVAHGLLEQFSLTEHAHAAGLVEGFMICEASARGGHLRRLYKRVIDTRPFWK